MSLLQDGSGMVIQEWFAILSRWAYWQSKYLLRSFASLGQGEKKVNAVL
jgi:hypothetical protein